LGAEPSANTLRAVVNVLPGEPSSDAWGVSHSSSSGRSQISSSILNGRPSRLDSFGSLSASQAYKDRDANKIWFRRQWSKIEQQQIVEIPGSLPFRAFGRSSQAGLSGCCAVFFGLMCGLLWSTGGSFEEIIVSYSHRDANKTFTIEKDLEGSVNVWYEIPNLVLNHKYVVQSKDDFLWAGMVKQYQCDRAATAQDARWKRPKDNSPDFNAMIDQSGSEQFRPCGLVALAMFTDTFEIFSSRGDKVALDESDLALEKDGDLYDDKILRISDNGYNVDGIPSWLTSKSAVERLKVWYRTPASPLVRHIYGRVPNGMPAGQYSLNFTVNDPVFELSWMVPEKRIVLSMSKALGSVGACRFLGGICAIIALFEIVSIGLFLLGPLLCGRVDKTSPEAFP